MAHQSSTKPIKTFLGSFTGADQLRLEKNRLEAFLSAMPGEYCSFTTDGRALFSQNFPTLLGISKIENLIDIQNTLNTEQAALLESHFNALQSRGEDFTMDVSLHSNGNHLNISGTCGQALDGSEAFHILWLKDITDQKKQVHLLETKSSESENETNKLKNILNSMPTCYWLRDEKGQLIWVNQSYVNLVKKSASTVIADQEEIIIKKPKNKGSQQAAKEIAQDAVKKQEALSLTGCVVQEGKRLFVEITETPLSQQNQSLGMLRDMTRTKEESNQYKRTIDANRTLLEQLRTAVTSFNAEQKLEFFNSAFAQLWGLEDQWLNQNPSLGDILEKLRETRRLPEQADFRSYKQGWLDMFTRLIDPLDDMMYLPDGSALRIFVMPNPSGGLIMTFEDVTSNLELESSYNTLIAVQKETLDNLAEGVVVFGGDGRLKLYNPSFARLWNLNPEDLENEPHVSQLAERMAIRFGKTKQESKKKQLIAHGIERAAQEGRMALGSEALIKFTTVPLPDGGVLVSYFDVTDSVKVENALREKNAALQTAERLKTDFLANVSYQLRTPLNAIMGFAEILNNKFFGDLNDKQEEYSQGIQEAGGKLVRLIDDILDLSTIEAGYLELSYDTFDVHPTLDDISSLTKEWALKQQIAVRLDCDENIGPLLADERRIKQILLNLIRNAINFTPENGTIGIIAQPENDFIKFTITDSGIGISEGDLERIFEPFERAVHEHRADMSPQALSRGAGLGLTLVRNIVDLHGGELNITSKEGQGTSVSFTIPKEIEEIEDIEPDFDDELNT